MRFVQACVAAVLVGTLLLAGLAPAARASEQWCEDDPLVLVTTPSGVVVPVYVTNGALGLEHLAALQLARITYSVRAVEGERATLVQMEVVVPGDWLDDQFKTRSTASTGPLKTGAVLASDTGVSGRPMYLQFKLNVG